MTMASLMQQGCSVRAMARTLGRAPSTISRELGRNGEDMRPYAAAPARASEPSFVSGGSPTKNRLLRPWLIHARHAFAGRVFQGLKFWPNVSLSHVFFLSMKSRIFLFLDLN
ncbi:hypothetical protein GALL_270880 [mine drainage metagenome]|uniref:Transposase IS30-like HTH domain-containing protein n=1 Tax=mine drainage metagenome TaxID=410659 RepID=A0A1J5R537_9ZZZZ